MNLYKNSREKKYLLYVNPSNIWLFFRKIHRVCTYNKAIQTNFLSMGTSHIGGLSVYQTPSLCTKASKDKQFENYILQISNERYGFYFTRILKFIN